MLLLLLCPYFCYSVTISYIPSTKSPPFPRYQSFMTHLKSRNSLIVYGGWDMITIYDDIWEYSLDLFSWKNVIFFGSENVGFSYPGARRGLGGYSSDTEQKFYIYGGMSKMGTENDLWCFDFMTMKWEKITTYKAPSSVSIFGYTSYEFESNKYFAIQSGSILDKYLNDLYV